MVDLWTNQNAEKQYEKSLAAERKASDLRNIELEKEKLEIERELENRKRIEKQNILKAELQQQIQELSESSLICTAQGISCSIMQLGFCLGFCILLVRSI